MNAKLFTFALWCWAALSWAQNNPLSLNFSPNEIQQKAKLSQLLDSAGQGCKIANYRVYYQPLKGDLQIIENKGDAFNTQLAKVLKKAEVGDIIRFNRIKSQQCGLSDTLLVKISPAQPSNSLGAAEMVRFRNFDDLFNAFPPRGWQVGCKVDFFTLYYTKKGKDPVQIQAAGNYFEGLVMNAIAAAASGDSYIFTVKANCGNFSVSIFIK